MSRKRTLDSPTSSSSKKRAAVKPGSQPRTIDHYFSSPAKKGPSTNEPGSSPKKQDADREIIDVDLLGSEDVKDEPEYTHSMSHSNPSRFIGFSGAQPIGHKPTFEDLSSDPASFDLQSAVASVATSGHQNNIPYSFLAEALSLVAGTRSRNEILDILTNTLRVIHAHHALSLLPAVYLLSNTLSPPYIPLELGLGPSSIFQAIQHVSGLSRPALHKLYVSTGDVGDVAFQAKSKTRTLIPPPPLLLHSVYDSLVSISKCKGQGASQRKQKIVEKLLVAAKGEEVRFLIRTLSQNLRVGAVRTSLLTSLARAMVLRPTDTTSIYHVTSNFLKDVRRGKKLKELTTKFAQAEALVRRVYVQHPDYGYLVEILLASGLDGLAQAAPLSMGVPIFATLGTPIRSLNMIYEHFGSRSFSAEFKYDGQRAQIHGWVDGDGKHNVRIFSRHLEDMTSKYPDVVSRLGTFLNRSDSIVSFILDSEIVAIDPQSKSLLSFQQLSNRGRKDVKMEDIKVRVGVFAFDLMYLNGESLLEQPLRERRAHLRTRFPASTGLDDSEIAAFAHVESCESEDGSLAIEAFWKKAVASKCEGLMVKLLDNQDPEDADTVDQRNSRKAVLNASYDADKRTFSWMKLKKDYINEASDSLDLIPIAGWHGSGRKSRWWSPILLGIWDHDSSRAVAVCKCMSGFSDQFYKDLNDRYMLTDESETCSRVSLWDCELGGFKPDVFFKPQEVWEIRGADITVSPVSLAALGHVDPMKGLSLRFPRFIRIRDDKDIEDASDTDFLVGLWQAQASHSPLKEVEPEEPGSPLDDGESA